MDKQTIEQGLQAISLVDAEMAAAFNQLGSPPVRVNPPGFETFLSTIISQQLSTKVAAVIKARVLELMPSVSAAALLAVADQDLRDAGLSWRKVEYAKGLAEAIVSGDFDVHGLAELTDDEAIETITQLRGFGCWSAEIYLMFSLQRLDVFPADDLGILLGLAQLKGLTEKPTPKQARELVKHWTPWRSVGALFLWSLYSHNNQLKKTSESA
ncbi:DNA-3-methyladenine glycosylase II [Psychromonas marina]|uniref:DNA-3-methyladenine glycosylase II n=1 Tax=Psychromonas marina TaxID=88364 RepID=A0ABQ6E288_9GAMM|nr:DNA-3-methyladenine glycosylase 2 family protein [Psychromonas marina]GLS91452.1 DNA-3-methyladenine glycosylase II [Psychromonas marina]